MGPKSNSGIKSMGFIVYPNEPVAYAMTLQYYYFIILLIIKGISRIASDILRESPFCALNWWILAGNITYSGSKFRNNNRTLAGHIGHWYAGVDFYPHSPARKPLLEQGCSLRSLSFGFPYNLYPQSFSKFNLHKIRDRMMLKLPTEIFPFKLSKYLR